MLDLAALNIELRPSPMLLAAGSSLHLLSGIAVAACNLPLGIKAMFLVGIALVLVQFGRQYACSGRKSFISHVELLDGRWRLTTGDGATHRASLIGGYAHPNIIILNFRLENRRRWSLALLPDSADPDALRRLRVWLRTRRDDAESDRA